MSIKANLNIVCPRAYAQGVRQLANWHATRKRRETARELAKAAERREVLERAKARYKAECREILEWAYARGAAIAAAKANGRFDSPTAGRAANAETAEAKGATSVHGGRR